MRPSIVSVAAVTVALLAGGCAGSSSPPATTVPESHLSMVTFLAKGNAICTATEASLKKAEKATSAAPSNDAVVLFLARHLIPATRAEVAELQALGRPVGDKGRITPILDTMDKTLAAVQANPAQAIEDANPFAASDDQLRAYGLTACAT